MSEGAFRQRTKPALQFTSPALTWSWILTIPVAVAVGAGRLGAATDPAVSPPGFELHEASAQDGTAQPGYGVPPEAMQVFVFEGTPASVRVTEHYLATDYGQSGVLFDRKSGAVLRRFTVADDWPETRPAEFAPRPDPRRRLRLVGPGVLDQWPGPRPADALQPFIILEAQFEDRTWRAMQPAGFLHEAGLRRPNTPGRPPAISWSDILRELNEHCYLESISNATGETNRFTTADGLAGNILTHLVPFGDSLWAACVDIYDPQAQRWGAGGLCRFDKRVGRWQRVNEIAGHPVRWVTLLQTVGNELWVGFREGRGVAGDQILFGMGLYPGIYRPETSALVLARLKDGAWSAFARPPRPESKPPQPWRASESAPPSTEFPCKLARVGDRVVLFSKADARHPSGNWEVPLNGGLSLLELSTGQWQTYDAERDLDADELADLVGEGGEVLVTSNRGLHRFDPATASWRFLDTHSPLRNSVLTAAAVVGDELWLGYGLQSFGVMGEQGISRYSEKTGQWSYLSPAELGTASPVKRMEVLPNGELWVLFGEWPWLGSAMRYLFYAREARTPRPAGLGKFVKGKWEFPVEGPPRRDRDASIPVNPWWHNEQDLAVVGNQLVVRGAESVFVGPKPWRQIATGGIIGIRATDDHQAVEIIRGIGDNVAWSQGRPAYEHAFYKPGAGELTFAKLNSTGQDGFFQYLMGSPSLSEAGKHAFALPGIKGNRGELWYAGKPFGQSVVESAAAIWLFAEGEVIRLDRRRLADGVRGHSGR